MEFSSGQYGKLTHRSMLRIYVSARMGLIYYLVLVFITLPIAILFAFGINQQMMGLAEKALYTFTFLILGICHIYTFPKYFKYHGKTAVLPDIVYTLLLAMIIFVADLLFFFFTALDPLQFAAAGAFSFLLPSAIFFSWNYFNDLLPPAEHTIWTLPADASEQKVTIFLNSLQIRLQLKMNWFDQSEKDFAVTVPGRIALGEMFYRFLKDKESKSVHIQLFDKEQKSFAWKFTLKKNMGNKILHPSQTIIQNQVCPNDIIIAERILQRADNSGLNA